MQEIDAFVARAKQALIDIGDGLTNITGDIQGLKDQLSASGTLSHDDRVKLDTTLSNLETLAVTCKQIAGIVPEPVVETGPSAGGESAGGEQPA